ncbi:MAG TPA: AI-2E family transporter [Alphaproteobacteria bacterium]|nr:AI-2E family transporter [Alphaproteobacteria bacterium]
MDQWQSRGPLIGAAKRGASGSESAYVERVVGLAVLLLLALGSLLVLRPFLPALLWAAILAVSTWPLYVRLERLLGGRRSLSALVMTGGVALVLLVPMLVLGFHLTEAAGEAAGLVREVLAEGIPPLPGWVSNIPIAGPRLQDFWVRTMHDSGTLSAALQPHIGEARSWLIALGGDLLQGMFQVIVSLFVAFFFYRDGRVTVAILSRIAARLAGHRSGRLLNVAGDTINGVVLGVIGTSLAQAILMGVAFALAGIPAVLLLGFLSFVFSLIPAALILVWLPAALWLAHQGHTAWAVFMGIWGGLFVGTLDNWLRPILIGQRSDLPLALVLLGVLGGALVFGFLGIFLGPVLLAVAYSLVRDWGSEHAAAADRQSAQIDAV